MNLSDTKIHQDGRSYYPEFAVIEAIKQLKDKFRERDLLDIMIDDYFTIDETLFNIFGYELIKSSSKECAK